MEKDNWVLLETIFLTDPVRIQFSGNELTGEVHGIKWSPLLATSNAMCALSELITETPSGHLKQEEFILAEDSQTLIGVKIFCRSDTSFTREIEVRRTRAQELLLQTITTRGVSQNTELQFDDADDPEMQSMVEKIALPVLEKFGGKRISQPIGVMLKEQTTPLQIRSIAEPPVKAISPGTETIRCQVDGFRRSDRVAFLRVGPREKFDVTFEVELSLEQIRRVAGDGRIHEVSICHKCNSKGQPEKVILAIHSVPDDGIGDFQLE